MNVMQHVERARSNHVLHLLGKIFPRWAAMMGWWWYNCVSKCTNQIALQMPCQECDEIIASAMLIVTTSPVSDRFCGIRSKNLKKHTVHHSHPSKKQHQ